MDKAKLTGECFCGSIAYEVRGQLKDPLSCHCSRCRKAFSAQASSYARVMADGFAWSRGQDLLRFYEGAHGFGIGFCSKCGSTLCGRFSGEIHGVTLGTLNSDPDIDEIHHIFVASKADWETVPEGVVEFDEGRPESSRR